MTVNSPVSPLLMLEHCGPMSKILRGFMPATLEQLGSTSTYQRRKLDNKRNVGEHDMSASECISGLQKR